MKQLIILTLFIALIFTGCTAKSDIEAENQTTNSDLEASLASMQAEIDALNEKLEQTTGSITSTTATEQKETTTTTTTTSTIKHNNVPSHNRPSASVNGIKPSEKTMSEEEMEKLQSIIDKFQTKAPLLNTADYTGKTVKEV